MEDNVIAKIQEAAEQQRNAMAEAGERLSDLSARSADLEERLAIVQAEYKTAWNEAAKSGWAETQLRAFGLKAPIRTGRQKQSRSTVQTRGHGTDLKVSALVDSNS